MVAYSFCVAFGITTGIVFGVLFAGSALSIIDFCSHVVCGWFSKKDDQQ